MEASLVIVSVVTWNSSDYIADCIDAVLESDYENFKLVIFDNASVDDTKAKVISTSSEKLEFIENSSNIGFSGGHNFVINNYIGDYYLILNPDAQIEKSYITNAVKSFARNPEIGSLAGLLFLNRSKTLLDCAGMSFTRSRRFILNHHRSIFDNENVFSKYVDGVDGAVAMYKKDAIDSIMIDKNFFDDSYFAYGEDWDVAWRLQLAGWSCFFQASCIGYHSRHFAQRSITHRKKISEINRTNSLRNSIVTIIKNDDIINIYKDFFPIFSRFIIVFIYSLIFETFALKAIFQVFSNLKIIIKKRKQIQSTRIISAIQVRERFIQN